MFKLMTAAGLHILAQRPEMIIRTVSYASKILHNPIVTVKQGKVQGTVETLYNGTSFYSFKGIPYAQPPVGQFRFQAPLPPQPWQGIHDATKHRDICTQLDTMGRCPSIGSEDCLFLNVYSKSLQPSSKIPVMVYIHGGAYLSGSGNDDFYGPKFLLEHDVVLVTFNYRLEVLGFLCLDTPEVPGNAGMKDQVAAMKWVKSNIAQFGGDPDNITLFGESSGACSVTYHMMSPMSQGLFNKAIAQSGTCIHDWAQGKDGKDRAFRVGKCLGKDTKDTTELLEFLRSLPASNLIKMTIKTTTPNERYRGLPIHFGPVVEKKHDHIESFINEDPMDIIQSKRMCSISLMLGYNSAESIMSLADRLKKLNVYNKDPSHDVPREIVNRISQEKINAMGESIRKFYVGAKEYRADDFKEIIAMLTDIHFGYNMHRFAYLYSKYNKSPIYMYRFNLVTDLNILKNVSGVDIKGACHTDELFYIFSANMTKNQYETQNKLRNYVWNITKLWTDFAKTSNPTPDYCQGVIWPKYTVKNKEYLDIDEKLTIGTFAERERVEFWNKLYREAELPCMNDL